MAVFETSCQWKASGCNVLLIQKVGEMVDTTQIVGFLFMKGDWGMCAVFATECKGKASGCNESLIQKMGEKRCGRTEWIGGK